MSVVQVVTAFPIPGHRAEVVAAFEAAIARVHNEPGVELYPLLEGPGRLVMIEKYESAQPRSEQIKGAAPRRPAVGVGRQARQRPRRAGPHPAPSRNPAEGSAVTAREYPPTESSSAREKGHRS